MSIPTILLAVLLAGLGTLTIHVNDVYGGGPVGVGSGHVGGVTVNDVIGGGPVTATHP